MTRTTSSFGLILLCSLILSTTTPISAAPCKYKRCAYTGDPHLIPYNKPFVQYWCQNEGWELLNGNAFVSVYVHVGPSPYLITDYAITFPGTPPCVLFDSASISSPWVTCGASSPVTTWTVTPGSHWIHFHKTQCLIVQIIKRSWWSSYFDIYIYQSAALIKKTKGVCIKWDCPVEAIFGTPLPVMTEVCSAFTELDGANLGKPVNKAAIPMAQMSCVNDLLTTFDARFAQGTIKSILTASAVGQMNGDNDRELFERVEKIEQTVLPAAIGEANRRIRNATQLCDESGQRCIRPIGQTDGGTVP